MKYIVCLLFSDDLKNIVLIRKNRPDWQKGLLNGPGGKVEEGESYDFAAHREFFEEAGISVPIWDHLAYQTEDNGKYEVCYVTAKTSYEHLNQVKSKTDEIVGMYTVEFIEQKNLVNSLKWLIPLAIYKLSGQVKSEKWRFRL